LKAFILSIGDIEKAIERYVDDVLIELTKGCDIKFIVEDTYQKESLTGYYKPELKGAEVSVLE
jgi:hypothetical protein